MTSLTPKVESQSGVEFLSHVYHVLAQPLTELHGTLELALLRESDLDTTRAVLRHSLAAAERAMASLYFCRDLVDANQPCDVDLIDLSQALRDIFEEFRPVAEESRVSFEALVGPELWIRGNLNRLMQALTRIMDCVLAASPRSIRLEPDAQGYRINVMGAGPDALAVEQSRSLELARVLLNAMHCELTSTDNAIAISTDDPQGGAGPSNAGPQAENTDSNELVSR